MRGAGPAVHGRSLGLLLLCCRYLVVFGYDLGEDITLCWVRPSSPPESAPIRQDCAGDSVSFNSNGWPEQFIEGETYDISYTAHIPSAPPNSEIVHANIHSCLRHVGFCTPFVKNTPELSTHSPALQGALENHMDTITSSVSLPAGQYTMIAHIRWVEEDGSVHDLARARVTDVEEPFDTVIYGLIAMAVVLFVIIFGMATYGVYRLARYFRHLRRVARRAYEQRVQRVLQAHRQTKKLAYPMVCISYLDFKSQGEMISHETAREKGVLVYFDKVEDIVEAERRYNIIFVSHQWTCHTHPDPKKAHFRAISEAIEHIAAQQRLDEKKLLVWIDYTSIPQRASSLQMLSISSLPIYASYSSHFLVVAPRVQNEVDAPVFDYSTYEARGWCRLEQWARITQQSISNMFICKGSDNEHGSPAVPAQEDAVFADNAMRVFQGVFTMEEDRAKLIDTMVGLYVMLLEEKDSDYKTTLLQEVHNNMLEVFPVAHFEDLINIADALVVRNNVPTKCEGEELDEVISKISRTNVGGHRYRQEQQAFCWGHCPSWGAKEDAASKKIQV